MPVSNAVRVSSTHWYKGLRRHVSQEAFTEWCNLEKERILLKHWKFKSDFLRMSRIGRHSRKIDFSLISPKHTFGWTYLRENSLKFQRFILRPKFKKVRNLHIMAFSVRGLKSSKFHASLRKQQGRRNNHMKTKLGTNIISFLYFEIV